MEDSNQNILQLCAVLIIVTHYNAARHRSSLHRAALLPPCLSPWERLYTSADDSSFLTITGFNRESFEGLKDILFQSLPVTAGRPSLLDSSAELGLFLLYVGSRMQIKYICLIFGATPSVCCRVIHKLLTLIPRKLQNHRAAKIEWPSPQIMEYYASLIHRREPSITNVIGFIDGVAVPVECSDDQFEQNAQYNGYYHDTTCNNVLAFSPTGKVIHASINFPGSWHDSAVSAGLIDLVLRTIGNYAMCVDQGFPHSGDLFDKFVGPMSKKVRRQLTSLLRDLLEARHATYISLRQSSEWGMRGLQGSFSRLKARLTSNKEKRKLIILSIILLHNFRTEYVGLNQIAEVFNPHYEQYIQLGTYDRIANYFL